MVKDANKQIVTSSSAKAELLNDFFTECYQDDNTCLDKELLPRLNISREITVVYISENDIIQSIKRLKSSTSRTPDNIPAIFIKRTGMNLVVPLLIIFRQILKNGTVPSFWSKSLIVPVFKSGLRSKINNYRPVSQTSVFCRLFEDIMRHYMYSHLKVNNILSTNQHGFIEKRSTMTNQLEMLDLLNSKFDNKVQTDMVLID